MPTKQELLEELQHLLEELEIISREASSNTGNSDEDTIWLEELRKDVQSTQNQIVTIKQSVEKQPTKLSDEMGDVVAPKEEKPAPQFVSMADAKKEAEEFVKQDKENQKTEKNKPPQPVTSLQEEREATDKVLTANNKDGKKQSPETEKEPLELEVKDGVSVLVENGELSGMKIEKEDKDEGLSASMEISKQLIAGEINKKWKILDYSTPGIPIILPWLQLKFDLKLEASLKARTEYKWADSSMELGIEGSFVGDGGVSLVINLAVVECGVRAGLEASAVATGTMRVVNNKPAVSFDGIKGKLDMAFKVFIKAADWMISIYTTLGGDEDDLTWEKELGRLNLLNFEVPGYKNGEMVGELKLEAGDDAKPFSELIDGAVGGIKAVYDAFVAVVEWIGEKVKAIAEFLADCVEALGEAIIAAVSPAYWLEMKKKAAQDELFKHAVEEAVKAIKRNKKYILELNKCKDDNSRYWLLVQLIKKEPLVQKVWSQIYQAENMQAAHDTIDQISVNIKTFHIKPTKDKYYLGGNVELLLIVESDRTFPVGAFVVGVLCNGKEVVKRGYSGTVNTGHWEKPFTLTLPATMDGVDMSKAKWECFAKLDIEGELKDQFAKNTLKVYKPTTTTTTTTITAKDLAASITLDSNEYDVGAIPADTMDAKVHIDIPANYDTSKLKGASLTFNLMFDNKVIATESMPNIQIKAGIRNTFTFMDIVMPGREDAIKHVYAPTSMGGNWVVGAAVMLANGQVIPIAVIPIKVTLPAK